MCPFAPAGKSSFACNLTMRWLRRGYLYYRPWGYECHHQQNLKTMRGAKSNALASRRANCDHVFPCGALLAFVPVICGGRRRGETGYEIDLQGHSREALFRSRESFLSSLALAA